MYKEMPILMDYYDKKRLQTNHWDYPISVPMELLDEETAKKNHGGQSLQRLAERGGLHPMEMLAVMEKRKWTVIPVVEAMDQLVHKLAAHKLEKENESEN